MNSTTSPNSTSMETGGVRHKAEKTKVAAKQERLEQKHPSVKHCWVFGLPWDLEWVTIQVRVKRCEQESNRTKQSARVSRVQTLGWSSNQSSLMPEKVLISQHVDVAYTSLYSPLLSLKSDWAVRGEKTCRADIPFESYRVCSFSAVWRWLTNEKMR